MNQLTAKGVVTMSSREIARLVQSKHGDVKRSAAATKAHDLFVIPLCRECHDKLHADVAAFEKKHGTQLELLFRFMNRALAIGVITKA